MGDAFARELIRRRLLPDVCNYCVSRNASVRVVQTGLLVACRDLPITFFSFKYLEFSDLKKLNTETRVHRTKFAITTFIAFLIFL